MLVFISIFHLFLRSLLTNVSPPQPRGVVAEDILDFISDVLADALPVIELQVDVREFAEIVCSLLLLREFV